ncbi:hypothetical protein ACR5KS_12390 [Leucobacter sp. W1153]|uniref:hypothetical protein n=1 Tax=Leucobacter sp. W1153 TaxID=3439064 RepID=UPI003F3C6A27
MSATDAQCGCDRCTCTDPSDLTLAGVPLCGCCAADCPDVHGAAAEERRAQFWREQGRAAQHAEEHEIAQIVRDRQHEQARPLSELATKLGLVLDDQSEDEEDYDGEHLGPSRRGAPGATTNTLGIWRYVVSRTPNSSELSGGGFEIRELYPAEDRPEFSYTSDPVTPAGATIDELREELLHMLAALDQPILDLTTDPPTLHL